MKSKAAEKYINNYDPTPFHETDRWSANLHIEQFVKYSVEIAEQEMIDKAVKGFCNCCPKRAKDNNNNNACNYMLFDTRCPYIKEFINELNK